MARHGIASIAPPERRCCGRRAGGPEVPGIRRSMSRKGGCLDNATIEQVFGHLKDGFHRGRTFDSYERFRPGLTRTSRTGTPDGTGKSPRDTPRRNSGTCPSRPRSCILINNVQQTGCSSLAGIRYDLEQEPGALLVDRHVVELADDQEPRPGDLPELRVESILLLRATRLHEHPGRGEKPDRYRAARACPT